MHRIDADSHVSNLFDGGDPLVPRLPTQVDPAWLNAVQEEIVNAILTAGIALVKGTNTQLSSAVLLRATDQVAAGIKTLTDGLVATGKATTGNAGVLGTGGTHSAVPGPGVKGLAGATTGGGGHSTAPGVWGDGVDRGPGVYGIGGVNGTGAGESSGMEGQGGASGAHGVKGTGGAGGFGVYGVAGSGSGGSGVCGARPGLENGNGVYGTVSGGANGVESYGVLGQVNGSHAAGWVRAGVLGDGSASSSYGVVAKGDTTSPVHAAFRVVPQDTAPTAPEEGAIYMNSVDHKLYFYNGTSWIPTT